MGNIILDCPLCKVFVILPLTQFDNRHGGMYLNNLKCINCQTILTPDYDGSIKIRGLS